MKLELDRDNGVPLTEQIVAGVQNWVHSRNAHAGTKLPSIRQLAADCGADGLAAQVSALMARAGGRPPRLRTSGVAALTPSERRVVTLAAKGMTNREVAQELYVTEKTVESHLGAAYRKLAVRPRAELVRALTPGQER